ncbi:sensor histidine kinase [Croceicoccus hydrothermalis]|uniref:sensor histidine kinase n=1 Tax=Croceicoccus hydrothermalis TaxID=2867964 RepID=UPI001EFA50DB|nr:histidine kinase [Croceicoccus hydrothermalis]
MNDDAPIGPSRVPLSTVLLSMAGLWACYFALVTARGWLLELEYQGELLALRGAVSLASIAVTMLLWLVLRGFDDRRIGLRVFIALFAALPAALLLAVINQRVFADVEMRVNARMAEKQGLRMHRDEAGNLLVDLPGLRAPPGIAPPEAPPPPDGDTSVPPESPPPPPAVPVPDGANSGTITIDSLSREEMMWRQLTDIALGRYFLLIAWAALYIALTQAQNARTAERREGEYRRAAKAAELRSLRYQVNPHFLFNTLNSLSALVMTGRAQQAETMIQSISTFYRRSLSGDPSGDVPLAEEIELQRAYLRIESVRFPERLHTAFDVPDALGDARVPGMILQPLIENSVKYAVAPLTRPVTIRVSAEEEYGRLVLTIADDGPGDALTGAKAEGCGIGVSNVRNRLRIRYGENATVVSGSTGAGWRTVIRMPLERVGPARSRRTEG